jgi:PHD/YefM family antitoxin component YafN of YafNO toxin-antitoxin module
MVQNLPIAEARTNLEALVKRIHLNKEYVILEKDGVPIAGIMDIDEFEDYLELQDQRVRHHVEKSTAEFRAGKGRLAEEFLEELRTPPQGTAKRRRKVKT